MLKLSRAARRLKGRYKLNKRKPILKRALMENGRMYEAWVHPTKGPRKQRVVEVEVPLMYVLMKRVGL